MLAVQCDHTKAPLEITFVCRFARRKPTHIYKKRDFSDDTSMGIRKNGFEGERNTHYATSFI
jgi:hypothetical protein